MDLFMNDNKSILGSARKKIKALYQNRL